MLLQFSNRYKREKERERERPKIKLNEIEMERGKKNGQVCLFQAKEYFDDFEIKNLIYIYIFPIFPV